MPRDTQIFSGSNESGSKDYTLPGNSELLLLAVNANFVDNGAGSNWSPAVVLFSDSGHVISRACDPSVQVTAGDDAEVSWFPGVKRGGGGAATTVPAALVIYQVPVGDLPAGDTYLPINLLRQTVASAFSQGGSGSNPFTINRPGVYLFALNTEIHNPHATAESIQFIFDAGPAFVDYLTGPPTIIEVVFPPTTDPYATLLNGVITGNVRVGQDEVDLRIVCSNTLVLGHLDLVVAQLSSGDMFAH